MAPAVEDRGMRLLHQAIGGLSREDALELLGMADRALAAGAAADGGGPPGLAAGFTPGTGRIEFNAVALHIARQARLVAADAAPSAPAALALREVREHLSARLERLGPPPAGGTGGPGATVPAPAPPVSPAPPAQGDVPGAALPGHDAALLPAMPDGEYVQRAHEIVLGRGATGPEVVSWMDRLERGTATRAGLLAALFEEAAAREDAAAAPAPLRVPSCLVMGTGRQLTLDQWRAEREAGAPTGTAPQPGFHHRFHIRTEPKVLVSVLCSLYRGGDFIEQFMDNIVSQDCFRDHAELLVVDAASPDGEQATIRRYLARHANIHYRRTDTRIGIYDAWNLAGRMARGEYLTNANLDDLRRRDSLSLQAGVLDNLPYVDVVYQDLYYTFDPHMSFDEIAAMGHRTTLPAVTLHGMVAYNAPHNAPMWRRRLHDELGWFDTRYRIAGDYEFWFRCMAAGKAFYKVNDAHVAYFQNPGGLSTRADTAAIGEARAITRAYCRRLHGEALTRPTRELAADLGIDAARIDAFPDRYAMVQAALRRLARTAKPAWQAREAG